MRCHGTLSSTNFRFTWDTCPSSLMNTLHLWKSERIIIIGAAAAAVAAAAAALLRNQSSFHARYSNEPEESDCRTFDGSLTSQSLSLSATGSGRREGRVGAPGGGDHNSFEVHLNHCFHILLQKKKKKKIPSLLRECELRWRPSGPAGFPVIMKWEQEISGVRDVDDEEGGEGRKGWGGKYWNLI